MTRALGLGFVVVTLGCGGEGGIEDQRPVDHKSAFEVLEEAGGDRYDPPADARLTGLQMEMYLKVKAREIELAKAAADSLRAQQAGGQGSVIEGIRALADVTDVLTADVRAAKELGYNSAEYQWVKQQIFETQVTNWLSDTSDRSRRESLQALRNGEAEAPTPELKQLYRDQIAVLEQQFSEAAEQGDPEQAEALRHNAELLKKYEAQLRQLDALERALPGSALKPPL